jgi:O-antigen ligase
MWYGIYGITFLLIAAQWKRFLYVTVRDKFLLLLVGIALISVLWSAAPEVTLFRSLALVGSTMVGAYLATRYSTGELLRLLAWALGLAAVLSLVVGLALPFYGVDQADIRGGWQGIYGGGKNALGRSMALSALVFLFLAFNAHKYRWIVWAGFGLSVGLLLLSKSQTSLVCFLIVLGLVLPFMAWRRHYTLGIACSMLILVTGGLIGLWLGGNLEGVLNVFGRDMTLTKRTELWPAVLDMISRRPWLGYGYGGFWLGMDGESAHVWLWSPGERFAHAHDGFLDLWLHLGLLGLLTFAVGFLLALRRAATRLFSANTLEESWPLAFLFFLLLYNFTESALLAHNNALWVLYVAVVLSMATGSSRTDV